VTLVGEFNFPGRYEVEKGERLSNVLRRAGGFSKSAYLRGAVFIRQRVKEQQLQVIEDVSRRLEEQSRNLLSQTSSEKDRETIIAAIEQRKVLLADVKNAPNLGRVVIRLDDVLKKGGSDDDITLENGDYLAVGSFPNIISIMGEVFNPTNVIYGKSNNSVGECLDKAGGVTEYGDAGNVYYVQPDGAVITPKNTSFFRWHSVEAGGTLVVPPKAPKKDYLDALSKITQIIYQIAISVGVAKTVFSP
jgi:polysaccharide export outer membrane protein